MTLWNVADVVTATIEAPDAETAAQLLRGALEAAGFDLFEAEEGTEPSGLPGALAAPARKPKLCPHDDNELYTESTPSGWLYLHCPGCGGRFTLNLVQCGEPREAR
jgi:hypothetical protein